MVLTSDKGKLIGAVAEINNQNLFLFPGEFINPLNYKTDKIGRLVFDKKNITAIGDVIIYKIDGKARKKKIGTLRIKDVLDKVVMTTGGVLLGDVYDMSGNDLYLRPGVNVDIRKFQITGEKGFILPISEILSIEDIIVYELPEMDPKLVHKNHDEQMFIDQFIELDSIKLRI